MKKRSLLKRERQQRKSIKEKRKREVVIRIEKRKIKVIYKKKYVTSNRTRTWKKVKNRNKIIMKECRRKEERKENVYSIE